MLKDFDMELREEHAGLPIFHRERFTELQLPWG